MHIKIGTRRGPLAMAQAQQVAYEITRNFPECTTEFITIQTTGDILYNQDLALIGGKGLFMKEIEEQLLGHQIDIAVHSMKDVPTMLPKGLAINCTLKREDSRDVFISFKYDSIDNLPEGAIIGSCSSRRRAQLLNLRPDLEMIQFRGNVPTRIQKLQEGQADAIILALAGLKRLNITDHATQILEHDVMLSAVSQGAIGIEHRVDDSDMGQILEKINHKETQICIEAERSFMHYMGGDCTTPLAAYAEIQDNNLSLRAMFASPDGANLFYSIQHGTIVDAIALGHLAAQEIQSKM